MPKPKITTIMLSEVSAAGTMLPADFMAESGRSCYRCGLTPANIEKKRRTNPSTALLQTVPPNPSDPLLRTRFECRNRTACDARRRRAENH